jgi:hypothetical protein
VVKKRIWPILIYGVRVADYPQKVEKKYTRHIKKENKRFHLGLKILRIRWLEKVEKIKNYVFLVVKVLYVKQVNRIIKESIVIQYDLKLAEIYNLKCRVTQCYKYQRYDYIKTAYYN